MPRNIRFKNFENRFTNKDFWPKLILNMALALTFFFGGGGEGVYGPFKNISHIEPTVHQKWAKTGEPGEKPPGHP